MHFDINQKVIAEYISMSHNLVFFLIFDSILMESLKIQCERLLVGWSKWDSSCQKPGWWSEVSIFLSALNSSKNICRL